MSKITILFLLCSTMMLCQNITGTLYDEEAPVSGAKIMNITSKSITSTDGSGNFEIFAQINDSLIFSSLFHHPKQIIVTHSHFQEGQVFEIKKMVNELDEVSLQGIINPKEMDEKEATKTLNQQLKNEIEKHSYKYEKANTGPLDIIAIGEALIKIFKKKSPKEEKIVVTYLIATDFDALFKTSDFFNDAFLILDLNITKDYRHLFFAYCESKDISSKFLGPENQIYLTDKFLEYSKEFLEILKESQNH